MEESIVDYLDGASTGRLGELLAHPGLSIRFLREHRERVRSLIDVGAWEFARDVELSDRSLALMAALVDQTRKVYRTEFLRSSLLLAELWLYRGAANRAHSVLIPLQTDSSLVFESDETLHFLKLVFWVNVSLGNGRQARTTAWCLLRRSASENLHIFANTLRFASSIASRYDAAVGSDAVLAGRNMIASGGILEEAQADARPIAASVAGEQRLSVGYPLGSRPVRRITFFALITVVAAPVYLYRHWLGRNNQAKTGDQSTSEVTPASSQ